MGLTVQERRVLKLIAEGYKHKDIAEGYGLSIHTVKNIMRVVCEKLGARNGTHAVFIGCKRGII